MWHIIIVCGVDRCEHEPFLPAAECVATLVGSHNEEHYFVATQDLDLRKRLRKVCTLVGPLFFFFSSMCTIGCEALQGRNHRFLYLTPMMLEG